MAFHLVLYGPDVIENMVNNAEWLSLAHLLESNINKISDAKLSFAVEEASQRASDVDLSILISSAPEKLHTRILTTAVRRGLWRSVSYMLIIGSVGKRLHAWAVEQATKSNDSEHLQNILRTCTHEQLDLAIDIALSRRLWTAAAELLYRQISDIKRTEVIEEAIKHAKDEDLANILPHCTDHQLDYALTEAVTRGLWGCVVRLLWRGTSDEQRRWAIEGVSQHASEDCLSNFVHCHDLTTDEIELVTKAAVKRELWDIVKKLLRLDLKYPQKLWVLTEACGHADFSKLDDICYGYEHILADVWDAVLPNLLAGQNWKRLNSLILFKRMHSNVSDEQRLLIAKSACELATEEDLLKILPCVCCGAAVDTAIPILLKREQWQVLGEVVLEKATEEQKLQIITEAIKHIQNENEPRLKKLLHDCPVDLLDSVTTEAVKRRCWSTVSDMFQKPVAAAVRWWAFKEAANHAKDTFFESMVYNCGKDLVDMLLREIISRKLWNALRTLLMNEAGSSQLQWAVEEACKHDSDERRLADILQCKCHTLDLNPILNKASERGMWNLVLDILKLPSGVSDNARRLAVEHAITHVNDSTLYRLLSHYNGDQLDSILDVVINRYMWKSAELLLRRNVSETQRRRIIEEAIKDNESSSGLLLHCTDDQLDSALAAAITRGLWECAGQLLCRGPSKDRCWFVISEAIKCASDDNNCIMESLIKQCCMHIDEDQRNSLLTAVVGRRLWSCTIEILSFGATIQQREWVFYEAFRYFSNKPKDYEDMFGPRLSDIICHCCTDHAFFEIALPCLLETGRFDIIWELVNRFDNISETQTTLILNVVSKRATGYELGSFIHRFCTRENVDMVLPELLQRGEWNALEKLLPNKITQIQHSSIVLEASMQASDYNLKRFLPLCPDDCLDKIVTETVKRGLWDIVCELLNRQVSDSVRRWAVEEGIKYAENEHFASIIRHSFQDQTDTVLTAAVSKQLWDVVEKLLHGEVETTKLQETVMELCKHADEDTLQRVLQNHETAWNFDLLLTEAVKREFWSVVIRLLKHPVGDTVRTWAVEEAIENAPNQQFQNIIPYCADGQLNCVLTEAIHRGFFNSVDVLFKRSVSDETRRWALVEACRYASDDQLAPLLTHCTDDQLSEMLTQTVRRHLWTCVQYLLNRGVTETQRKWAVLEASRYTIDECDFLSLISFCTHDQLESVLTMTLKRRMWRCVCKLMEREVSDDQKRHIVSEATLFTDVDLTPLLANCTDDIVCDVLEVALGTCQWHVVRQLTQHVDSHYLETFITKAAENWIADPDQVVRGAVRYKIWPVISYVIKNLQVNDMSHKLVAETSEYISDQDFTSITYTRAGTLIETLESAVLRNMPDTTYDILTRMGKEGDLRALNRLGHTVLKVIIGIKDGREKLVKECIRMGISTHQRDKDDILISVPRMTRHFQLTSFVGNSPFRAAVMHNDLSLVRLLYESGACSDHTVFMMKETLEYIGSFKSDLFRSTFQAVSAYIEEKTSTPRTLKSLCRLVISSHVGVGFTRQERVEQLEVPEELKDYVLFSDLTNVTTPDDNLSETGAAAALALNDACGRNAEFSSSDTDDYYDHYYSSNDDDYCYW